MYNHRKGKSSSFLREDSYPEIVLSRHKHYKRSKVYTRFRVFYMGDSMVSDNAGGLTRSSHAGQSRLLANSKILLSGISKLYSDKGTEINGRSQQIKDLSIHNHQIKTPPLSLTSSAWRMTTEKRIKHDVYSPSMSPKQRSTMPVKKQVFVQAERTLQQVESCSLTNGLLRSGHRYFRVLSR